MSEGNEPPDARSAVGASTPELTSDPRLQGEPSVAEVAAAEKWLAKRGVQVSPPTRLIALRLGGRWRIRQEMIVWIIFAGALAAVCSFAYRFVPGIDAPAIGYLYFYLILLGIPLLLAMRRGERSVRWAARPAGSSRLKLLGGWYLTSVAITFLGGAVLGVLMYLDSPDPPDRNYVRGWLGLLALGFLSVAVVVISVVRGPELAEDDASLAVDDALRAADAYLIVPALFAVLVPVDFMFDDRQPPGFAIWLVAYAVLAFGTQSAGLVALRRRYLSLPPGYYGAPVPVVSAPPAEIP
ncbi:MAG: hypothetical protein QOI21_3522 [Actinomycetota bacterium]|jgi:hypothetical protein|nr:hypothetical protein [Actinomycetota bacterium]